MAPQREPERHKKEEREGEKIVPQPKLNWKLEDIPFDRNPISTEL